jgi:uncharacterized UBP type Zn finger protein
MGFNAEQAKMALEQCEGNLERAVDWLFNHPDDSATEAANISHSDSAGKHLNKIFLKMSIFTHSSVLFL